MQDVRRIESIIGVINQHTSLNPTLINKLFKLIQFAYISLMSCNDIIIVKVQIGFV